jgi:hypothetical protein
VKKTSIPLSEFFYLGENIKKFIDFFELGEYDNDNHFQLERRMNGI